jgi:hypothetical protein
MHQLNKQSYPGLPRKHQRDSKLQLPTMYDVVPMIIKPATANTQGRSKSWSSSRKEKRMHNI